MTGELPIVTIGSVQVTESVSGLVPGLYGVYQITFAVPSEAVVGNLPIRITIGGVTSPAVYVSVQP